MKQKVEQNKKRSMYGSSRRRLTKKGNIKQTNFTYSPRPVYGSLSLEDLK